MPRSIDFGSRPPLSDENRRRIARLRLSGWVDYEAARSGVELCSDLIESPDKDRPEGAVVCGDPGMGKTHILKKIERDLNGNITRYGPSGARLRRVLRFDMPTVGTPDRIRLKILRTINHPIDKSIKSLEDVSNRAMKDMELDAIEIDEVQHAKRPANGSSTHKLLDEIKSISNELEVPLILAGAEGAEQTVAQDAPLSSRCDNLIFLQPWTLNEEYLMLLDTLEANANLKSESLLSTEAKADLILRASGGVTNDIFKIVRHSATLAISHGVESITEPIIRHHLSRSLRPTARLGG